MPPALRPILNSVLCLAAIGAPLLAQETPAKGSGWTVTTGLSWSQTPNYAGSSEHTSKVAPFGLIDYKGVVGLGGSRSVDGFGLYVRPYKTEVLTLGLLAVQTGKREDDDAKALAGMGDRRACFYLGAEASLDLGLLQTSLEVMKGSRREAGWAAALEVSRSFPLGESLELGLRTTGVWGDGTHQAWEFGITPAQAAARRQLLASGNTDLKARDGQAYHPSSGLAQVRAGVSLNWQITGHLLSSASVDYIRLVGDAADSPLTRQKGQTVPSVALLYQF